MESVYWFQIVFPCLLLICDSLEPDLSTVNKVLLWCRKPIVCWHNTLSSLPMLYECDANAWHWADAIEGCRKTALRLLTLGSVQGLDGLVLAGRQALFAGCDTLLAREYWPTSLPCCGRTPQSILAQHLPEDWHFEPGLNDKEGEVL